MHDGAAQGNRRGSRSEKNGIARSPSQELYPRVGLSKVGLKAERQLAVIRSLGKQRRNRQRNRQDSLTI